jgi:hypothetical protein
MPDLKDLYAKQHQKTGAFSHPSLNLDLELRDGNGNSLRIAVADANADLLDAGLLSGGSGGTSELCGLC